MKANYDNNKNFTATNAMAAPAIAGGYRLGNTDDSDLLFFMNVHPNPLWTLAEIDRITCNCPCMSSEAERQFERCQDAAAYKAELAGVIIKIRELAREALAPTPPPAQ